MVLTPKQLRSFYDRFGSRQDAQAFYEDAALDDLIAHAGFEGAERVFEFGCGTGRLALILIQKYLPASTSYLGIDLSRTMVELAGQRLRPYADRARIIHTNGAIHFPAPDHSIDRVVSTYVLDLLADADIRLALAEAARVLVPGGRVCLVSLTHGVTLVSRLVSSVWTALYHLHAPLVGGCRPVVLIDYLDAAIWQVEYHHVIVKSGMPSGILIAGRRQLAP